MPVIMFARQFPAYHPRAGEPTYFVEKLITSFIALDLPGYGTESIKRLRDLKYLDVSKILLEPSDKFHTVRAGHRFKPGDWFSPIVWMGKPYRSEQLILGPDVEVKKTWNILLDPIQVSIKLEGEEMSVAALRKIGLNDGLSIDDFTAWIVQPTMESPKPMDMQVICWNDKIEYP